MKRLLLILCCALPISFLCAQTPSNQEQAYTFAIEAIKLMDNGEYDASIELLQKACRLDSLNPTYPFEIGYALILKKDFGDAAQLYEKVVCMNGSTDQAYQMLGNAYSMNNEREKAIDAYKRGLAIYPNSGRLYLEMGNVHQHDTKLALELYEKGAKVDPAYPSNYYWLAKMYCASEQEIWGMLYGEVFINIERGSARTEEISKLLFDTYKSEIRFESDESIVVSFCKDHVMQLQTKEGVMPFTAIYEMEIISNIASIQAINLHSLHHIRTEFINSYFGKNYEKVYPNALFTWHKELMSKGFFESYNYWLLSGGAPDELNDWLQTNDSAFDAFIEWFKNNPMPVNAQTAFHRTKMY